MDESFYLNTDCFPDPAALVDAKVEATTASLVYSTQ